MMRLVPAIVTVAISAATTTGTSGELQCGTGKAKLRLLKRKGESSSDRTKFLIETSTIEVPVVNCWQVEFEVGTAVLLGEDDTGAWLVANNECQ